MNLEMLKLKRKTCVSRIKICTGHKRTELTLQKTKLVLRKSNFRHPHPLEYRGHFCILSQRTAKAKFDGKVCILNLVAHGEIDTTSSMSSPNFQEKIPLVSVVSSVQSHNKYQPGIYGGEVRKLLVCGGGILLQNYLLQTPYIKLKNQIGRWVNRYIDRQTGTNIYMHIN